MLRRVFVAADVYGVVINLRFESEGVLPTLPQLWSLIVEAFHHEVLILKPPFQDTQAFAIDKLMKFDESCSLWVDVVSASQVTDESQLFVVQSNREIPSHRVSRFVSRLPFSGESIRLPSVGTPPRRSPTPQAQPATDLSHMTNRVSPIRYHRQTPQQGIAPPAAALVTPQRAAQPTSNEPERNEHSSVQTPSRSLDPSSVIRRALVRRFQTSMIHSASQVNPVNAIQQFLQPGLRKLPPGDAETAHRILTSLPADMSPDVVLDCVLKCVPSLATVSQSITSCDLQPTPSPCHQPSSVPTVPDGEVSAKARIAELEGLEKAASAEHSRLVRQLESADSDVALLHERIMDMRVELATLENTLRNKETTVSVLQNDIAKLRTERASLCAQRTAVEALLQPVSVSRYLKSEPL